MSLIHKEKEQALCDCQVEEEVAMSPSGTTATHESVDVFDDTVAITLRRIEKFIPLGIFTRAEEYRITASLCLLYPRHVNDLEIVFARKGHSSKNRYAAILARTDIGFEVLIKGYCVSAGLRPTADITADTLNALKEVIELEMDARIEQQAKSGSKGWARANAKKGSESVVEHEEKKDSD